MKKISYLVLILVMTILITPTVFAKGNVEIKSIELESKSKSVDVNSEPTFKGLEMNFGLSFKQPGDYARYEVIIKNNSDKEFQISEDTSFNTSKYITYKYEVDKILKAKGETTVHVTITYEKAVAPELLVSGKYSEQNKAVVQLQNEEGEVVNPNTRLGISLVIIVLFIASIVVAILLNKQYFTKYSSLFMILIIFLLPIFVFAIDTLKLTINVDVEIEKGYEVSYELYNHYIKYTERSNYDMSDANCYEKYYIGEEKEENRYDYCSGFRIKDERLYGALDEVDLREIDEFYSIQTYDYNTNMDNCRSDDNKVYYCLPETSLETRDGVYEWKYKEKDYKNLKFKDYNDSSFDENNTIYVNAPQKFIMPDHDIIFYESIDR